jgi:HNH endonuclease
MPQLGKDCIWCDGSTANSDVSHILPRCFGNLDAQVLPKGVVCRSCNNFFGTQIEPALDKDPVIRAICVAFGIVDPGDGKVFRDRLSDQDPVPTARPMRTMDLNLRVSTNAFELEVTFDEVKRTFQKMYDPRSVALFSRAIHKLAFESFVWHQMKPEPQPAHLDLFDARFSPIRQWARRGQPQEKVRPLVRMAVDHISPEWEAQVWGFEQAQHVALQLRLFGDWLVVSLTSSQAQVQEHLVRWCSASPKPAWLISDIFGPLSAGNGGESA